MARRARTSARPPSSPPATPRRYTLTPKITGTYQTLPQPNTTYVATGCDGLPANSPDTRFPANLPDGPYQITKYVPYNDDHSQYTGGCEFNGAFTGDPIHRFYQMWQQTAAYHGRLFTWVANTAGDDNGAIPPAPIFQGGLQTGFYNMAQGDAPVLQRPGPALRHQRQLPPGGGGWHRRQPHRARHRFRCLLPERGGPGRRPAGRGDREPEPQAGHEQQLHPGRLRQRHRREHGRQLLRVRRPGPAGRRGRSTPT